VKKGFSMSQIDVSEDLEQEFQADESSEPVESEAEVQSEAQEVDWKAQAEAAAAEAAKYKRMAEQRAKKLEKAPEVGTKSKGLDYGMKAFLAASGIKGSDEIAIVEQAMRYSGESLEDLVDNPFVKTQLSALREAKAAQAAIPSGTKRSGTSPRTEIDYWLAKGELPPNTPENQDLRRKVVNAKLTRTKQVSKFGA
jgi:hypothetical protein